VSPAKEFGKRDLILIDETKGTYSARSITELINMLSKRDVPFTEKKRVLDFLSERLRVLERDLEFNTLQLIKEFNDKK
jgi:membrane-bound ClpP family serine protease